MISTLKNIWRNKEIRGKVLFTLFVISIFRILAHIPLPGINIQAFRQLFQQSEFLNLLNIFSGGALSNFSVTALGLNPYINASIIIQLLGMVIPALERLTQEGKEGQRRLTQYSRLITLPLAAIQSVGIYFLLRNQGIIGTLPWYKLVIMSITLITGTFLLVWLGELINEHGIGNGISILIFTGILSGMSVSFTQTLLIQSGQDLFKLGLFIFVLIAVIGGIILINEAQRIIPIQYAQRVRGRKLYGGQATHLPLRLNQAGVMPIIFALSLLLLPNMFASFLGNVPLGWVSSAAQLVSSALDNQLVYGFLYFVLVIGFTYFYTAIQFDPAELADNLKKQGGFIPGIRPGKNTRRYLEQIVSKITLVGAVFLGLVAVLPMIVPLITGVSTFRVGGTGLLIAVSTIIQTTKQLESMLVMRDYEGFLK